VVGLALAGLALCGADAGVGGRLVHGLADPNVAYVLFTVGLLGLLAELASPGVFVPGVVGAIALVLAFVGFATLPVNAAALVLLLLAAALFAAELFTQGVGVSAAAGLLSFVFGSLLLYALPTPHGPALRVNPWLIGINATALSGFFLVVVRALVRARRTPVSSGVEALVGRTGVAVTDLSPAGRVSVDGEIWSAVAEDDTIRAGEEVLVATVQGVTLRVIRAVSRDELENVSDREVHA
jgi:membrane-bound serine protease (ClpP class)